MIKKLEIRLRGTNGVGIFHDTKKDVRVLAKTCNELIGKVNELVIEVNELKSKNNTNTQSN